MAWTLVRVHWTKSLSAIWNDILITCMQEKKEQIINEVDLPIENQDLLKNAKKEWKSLFKEAEVISKETKISRVH